jgi:hypothetical protein
MSLQFIYDNKGNTTGVFISIEEWQALKTKYTDLQNAETENRAELALWQKQIIDARIIDYNKNPTDVADFDKTLDDVEESL